MCVCSAHNSNSGGRRPAIAFFFHMEFTSGSFKKDTADQSLCCVRTISTGVSMGPWLTEAAVWSILPCLALTSDSTFAACQAARNLKLQTPDAVLYQYCNPGTSYRNKKGPATPSRDHTPRPRWQILFFHCLIVTDGNYRTVSF